MAPIYTFAGDTPAIHGTAFVAPTASIIGKATLGADSSAFYGVSVRADTAAISVGAGSNLQDNVVLHADPASPAPSASASVSATAPSSTDAPLRTTASSA
ncbi:gamma carbonic anhydrase 2, mitochondrial [Arthrobacter sp. Hiyo8]|nr:gamma carbonic anhydrase 2, mitochondrial [Arthrobacter sp. Hiyo8]